MISVCLKLGSELWVEGLWPNKYPKKPKIFHKIFCKFQKLSLHQWKIYTHLGLQCKIIPLCPLQTISIPYFCPKLCIRVESRAERALHGWTRFSFQFSIHAIMGWLDETIRDLSRVQSKNTIEDKANINSDIVHWIDYRLFCSEI